MNVYGVVIFYTSSAALRAEKTLLQRNLAVKLIPTPRAFSSDCGVSLRFAWEEVETVRALLSVAKVEIAAVQQLS